MSIFLVVVYNNQEALKGYVHVRGGGQLHGQGTVAGSLASAFAKYLKVSFFASVNLYVYLVSRFVPLDCGALQVSAVVWRVQAQCAVVTLGSAPALNTLESS